MEQKEIDSIYHLFFNKMYSIEEIVKEFKDKYSYAQIKNQIKKFFENTYKTSYSYNELNQLYEETKKEL